MSLEKPDDGEDPLLSEVATDIVDGAPVDWDTVLAGAGSSHDVVRQLRVIADMVSFHQSPTDGAAPVSELPLPTTWGSLTILERIGGGAFGDVYRAWDQHLARHVVLKLLRADPGRNPNDVVDEGRLLARVRHPNVVTVYGADRIGDRAGLWMEFVHGRTLEQVLDERGRFSAEEAASIGSALCRALAAVHAAGLLHRDLKARNVMREEGGRIVLMDFGAGAERETAAMDAGDLVGTPLYLAPEVLKGGPATTESEIYSLGVLLFRLVSASYPLQATSLRDLIAAHARERQARLTDLRPDVPDSFIRVVERALDPDPRRRYSTIGELDAALKTVLAEGRGRWRSTFARVAAGLASRRAAVAVTALVAIVAGALAYERFHAGRNGPVTETGLGLTQRSSKVSVPALQMLGRPSADGAAVSYSDVNGDLAIFDTKTGQSRQITSKGDTTEYAEQSILSPDGSMVAYQWWTLDGAYELRVVATDGKWPRVVVSGVDAAYPVPIKWFADGERLLVLLYGRGGGARLAVVSTATRALRVLHTFTDALPFGVSLSSDDRFVVYDFPSGVDPLQRDLFILPVAASAGTAPRVLVGRAANETDPLWLPNDEGVFFLSDASGSIEGWQVRVANGVQADEPRMVVRNLERTQPLAVTSDGTLYYRFQTGTFDVKVAPFDPRLLMATDGSSTLPSRIASSNIQPSWSRDGRQLAFISQRGTSPFNHDSRVITIRDEATGRERDLRPGIWLDFVAPAWSADGRRLIVRGWDGVASNGYFIVDVESGVAAPVLAVDSIHNLSDYGSMQWWPGERAVVYEHARRGLIRRALDTGQEDIIVDYARARCTQRILRYGLSPDGSSVAFSGWTRERLGPVMTLFVAGVPGQCRELMRPQPKEQLAFQSWMPDGRRLLFTRVNGRPPHPLWAIDIDGGLSESAGLDIDGGTHVNGVALRPDGRALAFTAGAPSWELWAAEGFLAGR